MKDPKVIELVKQFNKDVKALNTTWKKLQSNDVYVRMELKGTGSYTEEKYLEVTQMTQNVEYFKGEKHGLVE